MCSSMCYYVPPPACPLTFGLRAGIVVQLFQVEMVESIELRQRAVCSGFRVSGWISLRSLRSSLCVLRVVPSCKASRKDRQASREDREESGEQRV
jgi:hypothetical protein